MPDLGKATYVLELESRKYDKDWEKEEAKTNKRVDALEKRLEGLEKTSDKMSKSMVDDQSDINDELKTSNKTWKTLTGSVDSHRRTTDRDSKSVRQHSGLLAKMGKTVVGLNQGFSLLGKTIGLIKWPALIAAGGAAGQAISALTAGVVALTGAITPAIGAVASLANAYLALGQAMAVIKIAGLQNLGKALQGDAEALKAIGPAGAKFVQTLKGMETQWKSMQRAVQAKLFTGLNEGVKAAKVNFGLFREAMVETAATMGNLAARAGRLLGSKGFGKAFHKVAEENQLVIWNLGKAFLSLSDAFLHVLVAARPLTTWLVKLTSAWAKGADQTARSAEGQKKLATFFQHTKEALTAVWNVLAPFTRALINVGSAGRKTGLNLLKHMGAAAESFRAFTESAKGRNTIQLWFKKAMPPLMAAGRLLSTITKELLKMGMSGDSLTPLLNTLNELTPVLAKLLVQTAKSFGPVLIDAIKNIGLLLGDLAGAAGPLTIFVKGISLIALALHKLMNSTPAIKTLTVTLLSLVGIISALGMAKFTSQLFGLGKGWTVVTGAVTKAKNAYLALTGAESAAGAAGVGAQAASAKRFGGAAPTGIVGSQLAMQEAGAATGATGLASSLGAIAVPAAIAAAAILAIVAAIVAFKDNFLGIQDIVMTVLGPVIDIFKSFAATIDDLSGGALGNFFEKLGPILPLLKTVGMWVLKLVGVFVILGALVGAAVTFGPFIAAIFLVTLAIKAVIAVINILKGVVGTVVGAFITGFNAIKSVVMTLLPVLKVLAVIALLPLIATVLMAVAAFKVLKAIGVAAFNAIKPVAMFVWNNIIKPLAQFVSGVLVKAFQTYKGIAVAAFNAVKGPAEAVFGLIKKVAGAVTGVLVGAFNKFKSVAGGAVDWVKDKISDIAGFIGGVAGKIGSAFASIFKGPINAVIAAINAIKIHISIHKGMPGPLPDINIDETVDPFPNIGMLARGGKVTTPSAIVGEEAPQHPEYVVATNPAYRSRNVGLWAQAGAELGMPGFAKGGRLPINDRVTNSYANYMNLPQVPHFAKGGIAQYNKTYPRGGGPAIPFNAAAAIAETVGLPGVTMAQVAIGESTLHPGAVSSDGGFGLWQMTPRVQSAETRNKWNAIGSFFNPFKNAKMAKLLPVSGKTYHGSSHVTGWNQHYSGPLMGTARTKKTKGKGTGAASPTTHLPAKLFNKIQSVGDLADLYDEYASRASTVGKAISGPNGITAEEVGWLQHELTVLFQLRNLLIKAFNYLQALWHGMPKTVAGEPVAAAAGGGGKGKGGGGGGGMPPKVKDMLAFGKMISGKNYPYQYGGGHGSFSPPYDCSGFVSAILHAGNLTNTTMTTDSLKTWGQSGVGDNVTVGVRGSTGRNAHTMMRVGPAFFESGSGHGAKKVSGWSGSFPIKRHPVGLKKGGIVGIKGKSAAHLNTTDPKAPGFVGWGLKKGGKKKKKGPRQENADRAAVLAERDDIKSRLDELQGIGSPMTPMASADLSTGIFGGRMLDVWSSIGGTGSVEDNSALTDLYRSQALAAQQRANVAEAQLPVFRDFFGAGSASGLAPYAGTFHEGGIVPGRSGQEVVGTLLAGERVVSHEEMNSGGGGGGGAVGVVVHGTIITDRDIQDAIEVTIDGKLRKDVSVSRRSNG